MITPFEEEIRQRILELEKKIKESKPEPISKEDIDKIIDEI